MEKLPEAKPTTKVDRIFSGESEETVFFHLQDTTHEFTMGLRDVLACVKYAEQKAYIPHLPIDWWNTIATTYHELGEYNITPED